MIIKSPHAREIPFDNSTNGFTSIITQDAIEEARNSSTPTFFCQFTKLDKMDFTQYLYSWNEVNNKRSGDITNGFRFGDADPILCPKSGVVFQANCAIRGVAVSTGTRASNVTVNFELWSVGWSNEGTKIGDIDFVVPFGNTVGTFWNSSVQTNFKQSISLNITVTQGNLLALKFIRIENNSNAVSIEQTVVSMGIR